MDLTAGQTSGVKQLHSLNQNSKTSTPYAPYSAKYKISGRGDRVQKCVHMAFKLEHLHSLEDTGGDGKVCTCNIICVKLNGSNM